MSALCMCIQARNKKSEEDLTFLLSFEMAHRPSLPLIPSDNTVIMATSLRRFSYVAERDLAFFS
jgi:hypothetical protein